MSFELPGLKSLGATRENPLTLASEAAKQPGYILPDRKPPAPPGAASSLNGSNSTPSPTKNFILENIRKAIGDPTPERAIKEQALDASGGLRRNQGANLQQLSSKLPSLDWEELARERIEKAAEESRRVKETQEKESEKPDAARSSEEALKLYRRQEELSQPIKIELPEPPPPREASLKDLATGGVTDAEKGDPGVNVVA